VGAAWFYRVADLDNLSTTAQEQPLGHFKIPRPQGDVANCTMHNFNVVPVRGRYLLVSANYSGGTSVADFTDPASASELGHFDPHGANTWSSYWYNNFIYTNDPGRGVDVVLLSDPARAAARKFPYLNPDPGVAAGLKRHNPRVAAASRSATAILGLKPRSGNRLATCSAAGSFRPVPARP
jgi:hypothetical protein